MASSIGFQDSVSFLLTIQATGFLTFTLVGLLPTEYASFVWTHPHALQIPPRDGHPALQRVAENLPDSLWPTRNYPRFRIWLPSSGHQRDFNPPEQRAAQHTPQSVADILKKHVTAPNP